MNKAKKIKEFKLEAGDYICVSGSKDKLIKLIKMSKPKEKDIKDYLTINEYEKMRINKSKEKELIKKCYEKKFKTQKYEKSNLYNTYEDIVIDVIQETAKEYEGKIKKLQEEIKGLHVLKMGFIA